MPIVGDPELLNRLASGDWTPPAIALKGSEAAGFVRIGVLNSSNFRCLFLLDDATYLVLGRMKLTLLN